MVRFDGQVWLGASFALLPFYYATDYDIDLTVQAKNGIRTEILVANIWVNQKGNAPEQGGSCGTDGGCGSAKCSH